MSSPKEETINLSLTENDYNLIYTALLHCRDTSRKNAAYEESKEIRESYLDKQEQFWKVIEKIERPACK